MKGRCVHHELTGRGDETFYITDCDDCLALAFQQHREAERERVLGDVADERCEYIERGLNVEQAVAAEREACAKIADANNNSGEGGILAAAIRARK